MEIHGRVAVITGAGSGIGRATATQLARDGASLIVVDVDEAGGRETVALVAQAGGKAAFLQADVADPAQLHAALRLARSTFGRLDILHNNAGIFTHPPGYPAAERDRWQRTLDVNLTAVIAGTQLAVEEMPEGGVVVNMGSSSGVTGWSGDPVYSAAKAGVLCFTRSCDRLYEKFKIRVNCVCPDIVDTPLVRRWMKDPPADLKLLDPAEVARVVVDVIRDESILCRVMEVHYGIAPVLR